MADRPKPSNMTARQETWFASLRSGLERDTGRSLEEWATIARTCPETAPRQRLAWLKTTHGLGQNRASAVLAATFPGEMGWDEPERLRAALWSDPHSSAILRAVEVAAGPLPDVTYAQRKSFTAFSRKVQFAAVRPVKGGRAMLGLALEAGADPRLEAPRNEAWSERLRSRLPLASPDDVDAVVTELLRQAWSRS
jgi:hypothetical protein